MRLVDSRPVHRLRAAWHARCRLLRALPWALPLLAGCWATDADAKVVFAFRLDPSLQQNFYFAKPSGVCSVYEATEFSVALGCTQGYPLSTSAKIEIKQRGADTNFGSLDIEDPAFGTTSAVLRDGTGHVLAQCKNDLGSCTTPGFMDSEPPPPIHYKDEYSVIVVKKVCTHYDDPDCI